MLHKKEPKRTWFVKAVCTRCCKTCNPDEPAPILGAARATLRRAPTFFGAMRILARPTTAAAEAVGREEEPVAPFTAYCTDRC